MSFRTFSEPANGEIKKNACLSAVINGMMAYETSNISKFIASLYFGK